MTKHESMNLASDCAQAMLKRDAASQAMGMSVRADMIQGHGTCHGGYLFALADSAFAFACNNYNDATVAIGCSIDYIAPARQGDTLTADCIEQSRSGRTGNYDVHIENQLGQLIALFHGKSYKVRGTLLTPENPNE